MAEDAAAGELREEREQYAVRRGLRVHFDHWRKGTLDENEGAISESELNRIKHPRDGDWRDLDPRVPDSYGLPRPQQRYHLGRVGESNDRARQEAETQLGNVLRAFEMTWTSFGIRFRRILGFGGFGVAALCDIQSQPSVTPVPVVVKIDLEFLRTMGAFFPATLAAEIAFHDRLRRALHIVQRLSVGDVVESQRQEAQRLKRKRGSDEDEEEEEVQAPARKKLKAIGARSKAMKTRAANIDNRREEPPRPHAQGHQARGDDRPPPGDGPAPAQDDQGQDDARDLDTMRIYMFLEYLELGDLDKWMKKAGNEGKRWPNLLLWKMFHCLYRACVAMGYPPIDQLPDDESRAEKTPLEEQAPDPSLKIKKSELVHFDIDPRNNRRPRVDERLAHYRNAWNELASLAIPYYDEAWQTRTRGKLHYYTPEQFTEEWDWVRGRPTGRAMWKPTAGKYGFHTNLYQCANVMWCLITGCKVQYPPQPTRQRLRRMNKERAEFEIVWSFGRQLLSQEYNDVDIDLRELIAECMNHNPYHRPTIPQLERAFERKLGPMERGRDDIEQLVQWCRDFFGSAAGGD